MDHTLLAQTPFPQGAATPSSGKGSSNVPENPKKPKPSGTVPPAAPDSKPGKKSGSSGTKKGSSGTKKGYSGTKKMITPRKHE
jgi:hypothetical protein